MTILAYNRWIIFAYDTYYPNGGLDDIHSSYKDYWEAVNKCKELGNDYVYIVNAENWRIEYDKYENKHKDLRD